MKPSYLALKSKCTDKIVFDLNGDQYGNTPTLSALFVWFPWTVFLIGAASILIALKLNDEGSDVA
ncbi:transmembrane protein, putative [Medicago truncatula]|uniref:Transmembrane protein, putative n=1 Tax=Medicago truncatula TaxID=3880 RepID=G7ZWG1_MEDTR|nr:transmembrane protein, putative [Medicago truncatula]